MSKYSNEFKLKVIEYCINKHHSYSDTAKHFSIKGKYTVLKWVRKYQEHGIQGLVRNNKKYDGKFEVNVVEYMHDNH